MNIDKKQVRQEHQQMMNTITAYLACTYHILNTSNIIEQFSQKLTDCLHENYMAPISYLDSYRARKERKIIQSIQVKN